MDRLLRRLARLLVRGPDAPFVLGDLEEGMRRDLERGVPPGRTRRRYLRNLVGSAASLARVRVRRASPGLPSFGPSWLDVKLGLRSLPKHPLLTTVSVLSLAIGIPVGLAPGFVIDAFEAPLPVEDGDRIRALRYWEVERPRPAPTTYEDFRFWRERLSAFGELGAARTREYNLDSDVDSPSPVSAAEVTGSTFRVLRVPPLLGRTLDAGDDAAGAPPVVVLGHDVWQSRLFADPDVVGRTVRVAGVPHTVVGVMPPAFRFPEDEQMWLPLREPAVAGLGGGAPLRVFGRLADGVSEEAAQAELSAVSAHAPREPADRDARVRAEVVGYAVAGNGLPAGGIRAVPGSWGFQVGAILLLLVACANVGLLIFARTATRSSEMAVRAAIGASRGRIVGQVFTEALVLAVLAVGAGLLLLAWLPDRVVATVWSPDWGGLPYWVDFGLTGRTVAWALGLAVFSAAVSAVVPALRVTGRAVQPSLQRIRAGGAFGIRFGLVTTALIVADIAFAVAGVGLTLGIANRMANVVSAPELDAFPASEYLAVEFTLAPPLSGDAQALDPSASTARLAATQQGLVARLEAQPRVRGVAVAGRLPRMDHSSAAIEVEGGGRPASYPFALVAPDYFEALDQPILAGRGFHAGDLEGDRSAVIVNAGFVELAMGGENPVGRRIRRVASLGGDNPGPWYEIVGLVPSLGMDLPEPEDKGAGIYFPAAPGEMNPLWLAVHVGADPTSFAPRLRELTGEVDPSVMISELTALDEVFPEDWYLFQGLMAGWGLFVVVLLTLASSGIYAMMAFTVAQRTREIGIRTALGARPTDIVADIGRRATIQLGSGALLGTLLGGRTYHMVREDTVTGGTALAVAALPALGIVLLVGLIACTTPLRRALRVMPTEAMRGE